MEKSLGFFFQTWHLDINKNVNYENIHLLKSAKAFFQTKTKMQTLENSYFIVKNTYIEISLHIILDNIMVTS